jgi:hypothetical protein
MGAGGLESLQGHRCIRAHRRAARRSHTRRTVRAVATWAVQMVLAAAVCGAVTFTCITFHPAEAADQTGQSLQVEPLFVSPRTPPLDAGGDGGAALPPIPDAKVPLHDAAITPLTAM